MGILSTNKKIINLGQGYSAGNGISIDDYVISYTGNEGQLYNAGPNIDIYDDQDQLYISGKDWSADIANASSNAYEKATALIPPEFDPSYISGVVDNKLDSTAFSTVSGDYATTSYVDMSDNLTYSRATAWGNQNLAPLNSVADNSAKWNEIEVYEQNSATYLTAHQDISNKLDTTAFSTVSGNFLTAHQVIPSAKWEDASDVVQSNSAQWSENTGDEEVNNAVYNNSANWNDITVYQTNSANYLTAHQSLDGYLTKSSADTLYQPIGSYALENDLEQVSGDLKGDIDYISGVAITAHQDISNKLDTTAFSTVSGTFLTAHQDLSNYATTGDLNTASGILSGAIDYLSGNAGKTYTGISPIVVNNTTNEISADSQDITFGEGLDFTNGVLTVTGAGTTYTGDAQGALDEVYANSGVWLTAHQDISNKLDTTAFSTVSGSFLTAHQPISANEWNSVYETVETNSGSWTGGGTSLTGDAQGAVDEVYSNSANWNDNYTTVTANSASWGGTPLPMSAGEGIDIQIENDTLVISATGGAGNPEVESYVQTNSASIDDVVSTYETNSGSYLTAHQDISNKLDTTAFSDVSGSFLTAINIPESANWNDATTAYQTNSATYMTEPNLEYNAVNEISGYNGSAIAQYGAEKQWLQHDDTIVHVSNSAQYAFGVNVSAVASLMPAPTILSTGTCDLNTNVFSGTSYVYWWKLSNGICRIKGLLRPNPANTPNTWNSVSFASGAPSAMFNNTIIPTVIDFCGWADFIHWNENGTLVFNTREVKLSAANQLVNFEFYGYYKEV